MKRWFLFFMIFCMACWSLPVFGQTEGEEPALKLYAQSAVLMDGDTGRILYGKGQDIIRPMASTTKIMTCILALELGKLEDEVAASKTAAAQPKVHLGVREGERYRLEDLLYALMLESYNDAAVMIAEEIGGSIQGFARLMNEKARALGCKNTWFITPNGLDGKETDENGQERIHSTTAAELARIMMYCIRESPQREAFLKITETQNWAFQDAEGKRSFQCVNHNALLTMMEGVLSGKTGFTGGAGYSYVGALENDGRTYIIALLGCGWPPHKTYKWSDARTLFGYGMKEYEKRDVFEPVELGPIPVAEAAGWKGETQQVQPLFSIGQSETEDKLQVPVLLKKGEQVEIRKRVPSILNAPVKEGEPIGSVDYILEGQVLRSFPLYADRTIQRRSLKGAFSDLLQKYILMEGCSI